jgi:ABC-type antimicrobial peptide transport system permease subunit
MMEVATLDAMATEQVRNERVYSVLFGLLAGLALLLAAVGVYGVMSFLVTQRTPEIGLRMALGAGRLSIVTLIFREGLFVAAGGLILGLVGAFFTSRLLQTLLNEVQALNYTAFGLATVVLLLAAAAACFYPALRASNVDPMRTLRAE